MSKNLAPVDSEPAIENKRKRPLERDEYIVVNKGFFRKKKQTTESNPEQIALIVEHVIARLDKAAEDDAKLNRNGQPAVSKLKTLHFLTNVMSKKQFHQGFLNHGIFSLLKKWLEPLPDGSLPNLTIRSAVLDILTNHLPVNLQNPIRREQLKKSGLGKVIMFLWKSDEEKMDNRKLAKELVFRWSRDIFDKSTDYEDLTRSRSCRLSSLATAKRRKDSSPVTANKGKDNNDAEGLRLFDQEVDFGLKAGLIDSSCRGSSIQIPERSSMNFVVRPEHNLDHRVKQLNREETGYMGKIRKKFRKLKESRRQQKMPGMKLTIQDRGILSRQDMHM